MTEEELLKSMDETFGEGAGERWRRHTAAEAKEIQELGNKVGYGRMIQIAQRALNRVPTSGERLCAKHSHLIHHLLYYAWKDIDFVYSNLTTVEKQLLTPQEFEELAEWVKE